MYVDHNTNNTYHNPHCHLNKKTISTNKLQAAVLPVAVEDVQLHSLKNDHYFDRITICWS